MIAVWTIVNVWGNFLIPFILLRSPSKAPAAVEVYSFYTQARPGQARPGQARPGQARLGLISAFSLLYSLPVVLMYVFVNRRYGFRFSGGLKG